MNVVDELHCQARVDPPASAILAPGSSPMSYAQLSGHLVRIGKMLSGFGLNPADRVAILLPQGPELAIACLSVMGVCTALPLNPDLREVEYRGMFERLRPAALLMMQDSLHPASAAAAAMEIGLIELVAAPSADGAPFDLVLERAVQCSAGRDLLSNEPAAILLQTSGTTSRPKVVPLSHDNLLESAKNVARSLRLDARDCCLHFLPMFHIGGIVDALLAPLLTGGRVACTPAFSIDALPRHLEEFSPTWTQSVPVVLDEVLAHVRRREGQLNGIRRLRLWRSVSAPLRAESLTEFEGRFGVPVIEIYGMTETAGVIASNPLTQAVRKPGSVGMAVGSSIRVLDTSGRSFPAGHEGEIVVAGRSVMAGYLDTSVEEHASVFSGEWLRTGDLGIIDDDGYLFLTGRIKELINRGGEKVSPGEIDAILLSHPGIADAATFAIPHAELGEDVGAAVVAKSGYEGLKSEEIIEFVRARVAFFKAPRVLKIIDAIPRGDNGKLQRGALAGLLQLVDGEQPVMGTFEAVTTPIARLIAGWWSDILGTRVDSRNDNFFHSGGNSLKATSFINRIQNNYSEIFYVSSMFDAPTVGEYENFIFKHYPAVAARMLGDAVAPQLEVGTRVNAEMLRSFSGLINRPSPSRCPDIKNGPAVFILSAPRSGSTLLRTMLAGHSRLFAPPELYLLSFDSLADRKSWFEGGQRGQLEGNIRALMQLSGTSAADATAMLEALEARACPTHEYYAMLQRLAEGRLLVDKTPDYAMDPAVLSHAEACFEAPYYIHLVRHPYGMIRSFEEARLDQLWFPRFVHQADGRQAVSPFTSRQFAEMVWLTINDNILAFLETIPPARHIRLSFEALVSEPLSSAQRICDLIGVGFEQAMLTPHDDRVARMTDGIHDVSRMIGDPKFHHYNKIENVVADQWKTAYVSDFLSHACLNTATAIGYLETVASLAGRVEIEL